LCATENGIDDCGAKAWARVLMRNNTLLTSVDLSGSKKKKKKRGRFLSQASQDFALFRLLRQCYWCRRHQSVVRRAPTQCVVDEHQLVECEMSVDFRCSSIRFESNEPVFFFRQSNPCRRRQSVGQITRQQQVFEDHQLVKLGRRERIFFLNQLQWAAGNQINDDGVKAWAELLKQNSSLINVDWTCKSTIFYFFCFLFSLFCSRLQVW
jgi:hypothetical protein